MKEIEGSAPVEYAPVCCTTCQSVLNPFCNVDFRMKTWLCSICLTGNNFPPHYANNISEQSLPFELMGDYTTLEYVIPNPNAANQNSRPIFMIIVDTAVSSDELVELKDSL